MPRASSDEDDGASSEASGMRLRRRRATKLTFGYNSDVERALRETSSESGSDEETGNQEIAATETPSGGARGRGGARGSARGGRGRGRGRGAKATPAGRATPAKKTKPADNEDEESDFKGSEAESESESAESDDDAAESESVETPSDDEPVKLSTTSKSKKTEDEADEEGKEGPKDADESPIEEPKAPPKKRGRTPGSKYKRAEVQDDPEKAGENVDGQLKEGPVEAKPARPAYKPPSAPEQSAESLADPNVQKLTDMIKTALEANGAVVAHAQPLDLTVKKGRPPTKGASSSTLNTHAPKTPAEPSGKGRESAVANGLAATASPAKALDPIPETPTPAEATLEPPSKRARGRARKTPLADENLVKLEEDSPTVAVPATPAPQPVLETPAPASRRGGRKRKIEEIKVEEAPATETAKEVKQPEAAETPSGTGANPEAEVAANTQAGPKQATKVFKVKQVNGRYQCYVPRCDKTFLNVEGIKYHSTHYVHEIIHLLLWAFPKNPKDKNKGDEKTSETPETLLPLIRDDVVALYNALGPNALPIKINDYPPYFTDTKSHRILPIVIGKGKERLGQAKREYVKRTPAAKAAQGSGTVNVESADDEDGVRTARKGRPRNVEDWEVSEKPVKKMAERAACWWDKHGTKEDLAERFVHRELRPRIGDFVVVNEPDAYLPKRPEVVVAFRKSTSGEPSNETLKRFESCKVDAKHKEGFVINVSGAVWGLEWCPGIPSEHAQYLAVGTRSATTENHEMLATRSPGPGCIQIWRIPRSKDKETLPELALCILHEHGDVWDLSWCPYGGFEAELPESEPQETLPRLGLLAVAFSDGTGACFAVPHPEALRDKPVRNQKTIFVTQRPFATIDTPDHYIWRVSWGGHTRLAVGCTDGFVGVWNVNELVRNALAVPRGNATKDSNRKGKQVVRDTVVEGSSPKKLPVTYPTHFFQAHDTVVSRLDWNDAYRRMRNRSFREACSDEKGRMPWPPEQPNELATSSYDGRATLTDIRNPRNNILLFRQRGFMMSLAFAPHCQAVTFPDVDDNIRFCTPLEEDTKRAKALDDDDLKAMLSRIFESHSNPVWDVEVSLFHPFVAAVSADGDLVLSNFDRINQRSTKVVQVTLYRLKFDKETATFTFVENIANQELKVEQRRWKHPLFAPEAAALHRTSWNRNWGSENLLASGGAGGLVRIDDVYT